ncbi:type II CAAX prenyl endopeptidase Rce1 family protein [Streptomyces sp. NPDC008139]|uniref:CPBP family glutamic-type intramembrane protease n=1 Tax=Streptomyces sp. NPDC008139 TaxID=3364814 RepID=UPI0036E13426
MRDTVEAIPEAGPGRRLSWPWFLVVVVVYVGIIQGLGPLIGVDTSDSDSQFPTTASLVRNALIPIEASIAFGAAVVSWLGWWGEVLRYRAPVRRRVRRVPVSMIAAVRRVPVSMIAAAVIGLNHPHLADQSLSLVACLLLLGLFVGVGEELMFRGIGVHVFRRAGFTEGKAALCASVVFGLVHASNAISQGPQALGQAAVVSTSGYFFYLCLRVGGVLVLPVLVHGLWDTSLISHLVGDNPQVLLGTLLIILLQVALIVVLLVRRRAIRPVSPAVPD